MDLGAGLEAKILFFQNMVMLQIKFKGNDTCINIVANIFPVDTPSTLGMRSKQFSESSRAAYQIKGNGE